MTISKEIRDREMDKFRDKRNKPVVAVTLEQVDIFTHYTINRGDCGRIESIDYYYNADKIFTKTYLYDANGDVIDMVKS